MTSKGLLKALMLCPMLLLLAFVSQAQKTITGKITDEKGNPITGASITVKGGKSGTVTDGSGSFSFTVPSSATAVTVTYVGYEPQNVSISSSPISVSLSPANSTLNEVVVVGYGTARKRDVTGAVASLQAKDFNKGVVSAPDQLLQGKIPGLEVNVNGGQPGGATITKIRGTNSIISGNEPLYVVDGIILDGRVPIPSVGSVSGLGNLPSSDPLIFINPNDIASIDVLKDASSCAIYGSRGANGVIQITTKRGQSSGPSKIEVGASVGVSDLMKQPDVLSASEYRSALKTYGYGSDSGASINPFKTIVQSAVTQNYNLAFSGGNENGKYRASFLASDQEGIVKNTGLTKYIATFTGDHNFIDHKLNISFDLTASNFSQQFTAISTDAGSTGNLISAAMNWNPTLNLVEPNGFYNFNNPNGQINPAAILDAYYDKANVTTILGNINAAYKIFPWLEYRMLYGVEYGTGSRNNQMQGWIQGTGGNADGKGQAVVGSSRLSSQTLTHTLTFNKAFGGSNLNVLLGYEYYKTDFSNQFTGVYGFDYNLTQASRIDANYYDNLQDGNQANLRTTTSTGPVAKLQSYFIRPTFNYRDRYIITATLRADGSSKFGVNNRYGYFPSVGVAWNISNEDFMKGNNIFDQLKLRLGYGKTGNQSFGAGLGQDQFYYGSYGSLSPVNKADSNLKWESVVSYDAGIEFSIFHNRISGSIDYYYKKTTDPIYPYPLAQPAPTGAVVWENLPGNIQNQGVELGLGGSIIQGKNFSWSLNINASYNKNKFVNPNIGTSPLVLTGSVTGQGVSNTFIQAIANNQPIDVFYLRQFTGFDKDGIAQTESQASSYSGDPTPHVLLGVSTTLDYKKLSLIVNTHGAFGNKIFNNTLVSVSNLGNIANGKNISKTLIGSPEGLANPVSASTRFLQSGNYMKMGNITINYNLGGMGNVIKSANIYVTAQNLFELTNYTGFDAEVNVEHGSGSVPSEGIDYIGYPTARTFTLGVNFSF